MTSQLQVTVYSTQPYDADFLRQAAVTGIQWHFVGEALNLQTASLAAGSQAVCVFVNDDLSAPVLTALRQQGVGAVALRCAGFNNVDIDAAKKLAVIEQATTPLQQIHTCNLYQYAEQLKDKTFRSPSLVIIGKVVSLHEQFSWLPNINSTEHYFTPLSGRLTQLEETTTKKKTC